MITRIALLALVVSLLDSTASSASSPAGTIGIYFDEAGTQRVRYSESFAGQDFEVWIGIHDPPGGVQAIDFDFSNANLFIIVYDLEILPACSSPECEIAATGIIPLSIQVAFDECAPGTGFQPLVRAKLAVMVDPGSTREFLCVLPDLESRVPLDREPRYQDCEGNWRDAMGEVICYDDGEPLPEEYFYETTCSILHRELNFIYGDCAVPNDETSWGSMKARY